MSKRDEWQKILLSDVCEINPRRPPSISKLSDDYRVTFVPMSAVDQHTATICRPEKRPFGEVRKGFTYFEEGDVIFAKITPCMQNGKSAIARGLENGVGLGSTEFHVIRPNIERILPEWVWYFVRQGPFLEDATRFFQGAVGQQRVPASFLKKTAIPLPPLPEQRRIVARIKECMERVEEIERLRGMQKTDLKVIQDAIIEAEVEQSWPKAKLADILESTRNGWSGKRVPDGVQVGILRLSCVHGRAITDSDTKPATLTEQARKEFHIVQNDVLLVRGNGSPRLVGRTAIAMKTKPDVVFSDLLIRMRPADRMLPPFLNLVFHTNEVRRQILHHSKTAAGIWKINQKNLLKIEIPVPPVDVQKRFVENVGEALLCASEFSKLLIGSETCHLRDAILRKAFSGEL